MSNPLETPTPEQSAVPSAASGGYDDVVERLLPVAHRIKNVENALRMLMKEPGLDEPLRREAKTLKQAFENRRLAIMAMLDEAHNHHNSDYQTPVG